MKASITGINGFIGSALAKKLKSLEWEVYENIRRDVDVVFLFGSPSSNELYKENMDTCFEETIGGFLNAIQFCRDHKIKLVYPSSGTVYRKDTAYARCKACLEEIQLAYNTNCLGLRIFAGYGPGEAHKTYYSSVVYQFCKEMKEGKSPTIWGDGTQTRDFIYIDDITNAIISFLTIGSYEPIIDLGTGKNIPFNDLVEVINKELGTDINPNYIDKPQNYCQETLCDTTILQKYYTPRISIEEGVKRCLQSLY
jgi:UDP-glucose 4-epimerase